MAMTTPILYSGELGPQIQPGNLDKHIRTYPLISTLLIAGVD